MASPLVTATTTSTPRRATFPRATTMTSPLLRAKTMMIMPQTTMTVNTMANIYKQQLTNNTRVQWRRKRRGGTTRAHPQRWGHRSCCCLYQQCWHPIVQVTPDRLCPCLLWSKEGGASGQPLARGSTMRGRGTGGRQHNR
jgi:hypothetical protein